MHLTLRIFCDILILQCDLQVTTLIALISVAILNFLTTAACYIIIYLSLNISMRCIETFFLMF